MSTVKMIKMDRGWLRAQLIISIVYLVISMIMVIASVYVMVQGLYIEGMIYLLSYIMTLLVSLIMLVKMRGLLKGSHAHVIEEREERFIILQQGGWLIFALGFSIVLLLQSPVFEISVAFMALNMIASVLFLVTSITLVIRNKVKYDIRISP